MSSSRDKFLQLKHALENEETTFEIGNVTDRRRRSCMVYKYGDCNLIYGLDVWKDYELPQPQQLDRPELIAISDDGGKNIAIVEEYVFLSDASLDLDVEVAPYLIDNQIAAMNKRLSSTIVEAYKNNLKIDDFNKNRVLEEAAHIARIAEINGAPIDTYYEIVDETEYYGVRSGVLDEDDEALRYCEENKFSLMVDKIAEELLEQGVLNNTQAALAKALRELGENVKAITLVFEKDGARASAKITPQSLQGSLEDKKDVLSSYQFKNDKEYDAVRELFGAPDVPCRASMTPTIYDIESVTYGNKTLYTRDDSDQKAVGKKETVKGKKRADTYER